ncbi:AI-2E family transporter [Rhodobacter lacus]|uniref:AI-2E family transporter n=1 Tax=Rhodobacter lacus TaxID=1641972 RepID=A0ABW5ABW6_9RHOB
MERTAQLSLIALGAIATVAALSALRELAAPMALALVFGIVLSPLSDFWERRGLAPSIGASLSLVLTLATLGTLGLLLQPLVSDLVAQAPKVWADSQALLKAFHDLLKGLVDASREVSGAGGGEAALPQGMVGLPSLSGALMIAPQIAAQLLTFIGTLFFFLLTRIEIYDWAARRLASPAGRGQLAQRLRHAETTVSRYFLTITLINAALGIATAGVLELIGLPGALSWGIVAFVLNFVVYLGPAATAVALALAGVAAFDGAAALFPVAAYGALITLEGQFVTPALVGRRMALNPLLVFVALLFGLWLWGAIGGIVAIPLMLWGVVLQNGGGIEPRQG